MSWSIRSTGEAKHAHADFEREANKVLHGRNGFEQTAIRACIPVVETTTKHAALTELHASVEAYGHHNEDGSGGVDLRVSLHQHVIVTPPPPATTETGPTADNEQTPAPNDGAGAPTSTEGGE